MLPTFPQLVLFEDEETVVISKPVGIAVHRSDIIDPKEEVLLSILRRQLGTRLYPVHRLDRATSGALIFAKSPAAAANLSLQWRQGEVHKLYLAVCRGWTPEFLRIEKSLRVLDAPDKEAQSAVTELERIASVLWPVAIETYPESRFSLLALNPKTGRRHQLRRHLAQSHHPLIGDTSYGRGAYNRYFRAAFACQRLMLHHLALSWKDARGKHCSVQAPWDEAWENVMQAFGWSGAFKLWQESHGMNPPRASEL